MHLLMVVHITFYEIFLQNNQSKRIKHLVVREGGTQTWRVQRVGTVVKQAAKHRTQTNTLGIFVHKHKRRIENRIPKILETS